MIKTNFDKWNTDLGIWKTYIEHWKIDIGQWKTDP